MVMKLTITMMMVNPDLLTAVIRNDEGDQREESQEVDRKYCIQQEEASFPLDVNAKMTDGEGPVGDSIGHSF